MIKPNIEDYNLNINEIKKLQKISEKNPSRIFTVSFIIWFLGLFFLFPISTYYIFLELLVAVTMSIPTAMIAVPLVEYSIKICVPEYKEYKKFKNDSKNYQIWEIKAQKEFWFSLTGIQFEHELANLFLRLGYKAKVTTASGDMGVDIWLNKGSEKIIVQCKAHKNRIGPSAVRELYGTMQHFNVKKAILASVSGFTKGAFDASLNKPIELMELSEILHLQGSLKMNIGQLGTFGSKSPRE